MKRIHVTTSDPEKRTIILLVRAFVEEGNEKGNKKKPSHTSNNPLEQKFWPAAGMGYPGYHGYNRRW